MRPRHALASWMLLAVPPTATAEDVAAPPPIVREARVVEVDGTPETWRLEWLHPPTPVCEAEEDGLFTCLCQGFELGEQGELDLVRIRSSREVDRLHLTPLFAKEETAPGAAEQKHAALRRAPFSVLEVADFDRDGQATEFVLQIGTLPCGKRQSVLVGVSRDRPQLHVFGSAEHPDEPLVLFFQHWERLRTDIGPLRLVTWPCGDHGSEVHQELGLEVDASGIHATRETYSCDAPGENHGELLSRKVL